MRRFFTLSFAGLVVAFAAAGYAATTDSLAGNTPPATKDAKTAAEDALLSRTLGDFLAAAAPITTNTLTGFYAEIPANLDSAVRRIAEENYTSAGELLKSELDKATDTKQRARVLMWLGINYGTQGIDYPNTGWVYGTTATAYLKQAIELDPEVFTAPDVARIYAEMYAHGWAEEDASAVLDKYEKKAEQSRRSIDFYFAGMISKRMGIRAWSYSDTTEQDKRTVSNFSKAVALQPTRYENWPAYLKALMPVGLHDLATTEANKMYAYFKPLRTPLLGDQGPALLLMQTASYRTMQMDEDMIAQLEKERPDSPLPVFERGMRAIETTATDAVKIFPEFIKKVDSGAIKLEPREQGYLPSAYYKLGFLQQQFKDVSGALATYTKLKELSPHYAEVDTNLAVVHAQLAESETTGPKKLALLRKAVAFAQSQEKHDYRGRAALKASELRMRLRNAARKVEEEIEAARTSGAAGQTSASAGAK